METAEIRRRWLRYFSTRGHTVVPSASLVPSGATAGAPLFVDSGLVPFSSFLVGQQPAPFTRATSVQKCVRAADLDDAGRTSRHSTFFQLNGNFSFGDYGPAGAIELAWELITRHQSDGGYGLDDSRIWVTVLHDDQETINAWQRVTGISPERIVRRGPNENYWHAGLPGPGGPRSGIYIDRGPEFGPDGGPEAGEDRYLQFWGLTFLRDQVAGVRGMGNVDIAGPLPVRSIGSGMGLERMACLLQGVDTVIEIDEVYPIIARIEELSGRRYGAGVAADVPMRVVADHVRSALVLIGDGVTPADESRDPRGFVVRRLLRGALAALAELGVQEPVIADLLSVARDRMDAVYPELVTRFPDIAQAAAVEERDVLAAAPGAAVGSIPSAADEPAAEHAADEPDEFAAIPAEVMGSGPVEFTGFRELSTGTTVRALIDRGELLRSAGAGQTVQVVLDRTPFYPQAGGQLADQGEIAAGSARLRVLDVQRLLASDLIVHTAKVAEGTIHSGQDVQASVDREWRLSACQAHSATHVLHAALRQVLGPQTQQLDSANRPGQLRIDLALDSLIDPATLAEIESVANLALRYDYPVTATYMTHSQAMALGALAAVVPDSPDSPDSADQPVRVVEMGGAWSRELCEGTHVEHASQIGSITVVGQSQPEPGRLRIDALAGLEALQHLQRDRARVSELSAVLQVPAEQLTERVTALLADLARAREAVSRPAWIPAAIAGPATAGQAAAPTPLPKRMEDAASQQRRAALLAGAAQLAQAPSDVFGVSVVTHNAGPAGADDARALVLDVRDRLPADRPGVVAVSVLVDERPLVVVATNGEARHWGVHAGDLIEAAAGVLGPRFDLDDAPGPALDGADVASGAGSDPAKVGEALRRIEYSVGERVTSRG